MNRYIPFIVGCAVLAVIISIVVWQLRPMPGPIALDPGPIVPMSGPDIPAAEVELPEERRIRFTVKQLLLLCLSNVSQVSRADASASLSASIKEIGTSAAAGRMEEISTGASNALPPAERLAESGMIHSCISKNLPTILAALPLPSTPPVVTTSKMTPASVSPNTSQINPPSGIEHAFPGKTDVEASETNIQKTCIKIVGLAELKYSSGHKTRFCQARKFFGVTNFPDSSYRGHGGGFCYSGDENQCLIKALQGEWLH